MKEQGQHGKGDEGNHRVEEGHRPGQGIDDEADSSPSDADLHVADSGRVGQELG